MKVCKKINNLIWRSRIAFQKRLINFQDRSGLYSYQRWITENETPLSQYNSVIKNLTITPVFCFLIACKETNPDLLLETIQSIRKQIYSHWKIIVVGSRIERNYIHPLEQDTQVNYHIVPQEINFNQAIIAKITQVQSDYLILTYPGDTPAPNLLLELAESIQRGAKHDIIYYDEDYMDARENERLSPFFKPNWSPELMLSVNYLIHAAFRLEFLSEIINQTKDNSIQSYSDLTFRASETAGSIHHIPKILYHRDIGAMQPSSTELLSHCKDVENHLRRTGINKPQADIIKDTYVRVSWPVNELTTSIIIPTKDNFEVLKTCLNSIKRFTKSVPYEIILVDSGSQDDLTIQYYQQLVNEPNLNLVQYDCGDTFNFNTALNIGADHASGDVLVFLNNDTEILEDGWMEEMIRWAVRPEIGVVGAKLLYPDRRIQHAGIIIGMEGHASHVFAGAGEGSQGPFGSVEWYRNYSAVTGACIAIRSDVFKQIGGFDEEYRLVFSDVQFCLQVINAGYRVVYTPYARLLHHEGRSRFHYIPAKDIHLAYSHFKPIVETGDSYYNPNLSLSVRIPTYRRTNEPIPIERLDRINAEASS